MEFAPLSLLALIGAVSLACQWLAWRLRVPAILPLLLAGLLLGPVLGVLDPDQLFGEVMFPLVTLAVAIILFEGALTLDLKEIRGHGSVVRNLVSVGLLVTWIVIAGAAYYLLALPWLLASLFGALVVVTGPTVIVPLLRAARPTQRLANILRWEGILIDPLGALLAVLVYQFIVSSREQALANAAGVFIGTLLLGALLGWLAARVTERAINHHWMPPYLRNPAMLCFMLGIYALSNALLLESGLLTVTVMGVILANRRNLDMESIHQFKETLSVLLISALFILLAARLEVAQLTALGWEVVALMAVVQLVARPLCVYLSAWRSDLSLRDKLLLAWIAPRGIVAAAVSGLFALKLEQHGINGSEVLVPLVFLVIISTVVLQSLTVGRLTQWLGLRQSAQQGFVIFGANAGARRIAGELQHAGVPVRLADTNWENLRLARMDNLPVYYGNPASEHAEGHLVLEGIGRGLLLSPYQQLNPLVALHFREWFGSHKVYALAASDPAQSHSRRGGSSRHAPIVLCKALTYGKLASTLARGGSVKTTRLSDSFSLHDYRAAYGERALPLFMIQPDGRCQVWAEVQFDSVPRAGSVIALIAPQPAPSPPASREKLS